MYEPRVLVYVAKGRKTLLLASKWQGVPIGHERRRSIPIPWDSAQQAEGVQADKAVRLHMRADLYAALRGLRQQETWTAKY